MLTRAHATAMLPTTNVDRAVRFYEEKLGFHPKSKLPNGEVLFESDGLEFALYPRATPPKADHTSLTWEVSDVKAEVSDLRQRGVRFEDYPEMKTREGIAEWGNEKAAWFKDPDGNILCIHETH